MNTTVLPQKQLTFIVVMIHGFVPFVHSFTHYFTNLAHLNYAHFYGESSNTTMLSSLITYYLSKMRVHMIKGCDRAS